VSFYIFDQITLKWWRFGNNIAYYACLMILGYITVAILLWFLAVLTGAVITQNTQNTRERLLHSIIKAFSNVPNMSESISNRQSDDDIGDVVRFAFLTGILGTILMCMSAVLIISLIKILYAFGLGLLRVDHYLRNYYAYDQSEIIKDPVGYMAFATSILLFLIVLCAQLIWVALSNAI
jgi:hypothetical protein